MKRSCPYPAWMAKIIQARAPWVDEAWIRSRFREWCIAHDADPATSYGLQILLYTHERQPHWDEISRASRLAACRELEIRAMERVTLAAIGA